MEEKKYKMLEEENFKRVIIEVNSFIGTREIVLYLVSVLDNHKIPKRYRNKEDIYFLVHEHNWKYQKHNKVMRVDIFIKQGDYFKELTHILINPKIIVPKLRR